MVIAVAWLPVLKRMLSLVPLPEVNSSVNVDEAVVPPITSGTVTEVLIVGVALKDGAPPLAVRIVFVPPCAVAPMAPVPLP